MSFNSKLWLAIYLAASITLASCSNENAGNPLSVSSTNADNSKEQYIVVVNNQTSLQSNILYNSELTAKTILSTYNIPNTNIVALYDKVFTGFCAALTSNQVAELRKDKRISQIEKDQPIYLQGFLEPTSSKQQPILLGQTTPWGITKVGGSVDATSNTGVAWIVDTGIDSNHPELNVNTSLGRTFVTTGQDALTTDDLHGHGSHVSGIIAAKNNSEGVVGVCAGATVIPIKVFDYRGAGYMSTIISGLNYIAGNLVSGKINVVNMSLGGSAYTLLDNAVANLASKGAYIVIAAGNNFKNSNNYSPARANGTRIYTISAYDNSDKFATFSNWANAPVDYSAPGVSIYSTYKNGGYATMSGTSMACPHVVGVILANNGSINSNGTVINDPDGSPDIKATR